MGKTRKEHSLNTSCWLSIVLGSLQSSCNLLSFKIKDGDSKQLLSIHCVLGKNLDIYHFN